MQSLDRALAILTTFSPVQPYLGVGEIAHRTGLTPSTTHRILMSLLKHQLVMKVDLRGRYGLGPRLLSLASVANETLNIGELARPFMIRLRDETGETVGLHILEANRRIVIDQVQSRETLRRTYTEVGQPLPLHQGAPGKVLLAFASDKGAYESRVESRL